MAKYILSDPNFSDGKRKEVIDQIIAPYRNRPGLKLIGYEPDADFDRLPVELLGRPEVMKDAILESCAKAYELIDMEKQTGHHPRIGAVDTIEIYPAKDVTIEECRELAEEIGKEIFKRHQVPVFFTGKNAHAARSRRADGHSQGQLRRAERRSPQGSEPRAGSRSRQAASNRWSDDRRSS